MRLLLAFSRKKKIPFLIYKIEEDSDRQWYSGYQNLDDFKNLVYYGNKPNLNELFRLVQWGLSTKQLPSIHTSDLYLTNTFEAADHYKIKGSVYIFPFFKRNDKKSYLKMNYYN